MLYFCVVVPYNRITSLTGADEPAPAVTSEQLLAEIRDLLREQNRQG